jgi:hypothetical protein
MKLSPEIAGERVPSRGHLHITAIYLLLTIARYWGIADIVGAGGHFR